eukprot:2525156-Prymnesium_polylepis.2
MSRWARDAGTTARPTEGRRAAMPKRKLDDDPGEAEAEAELQRALAAADAAPDDEEVSGLGSGCAPLVWRVEPAAPAPAQYKRGAARGEAPLVFAYLSIRGLGETPRLMLAEAGAAYIHVAATMGEGQDVSLEWRTRSPNGLMPMLSGLSVPRAAPISQSGGARGATLALSRFSLSSLLSLCAMHRRPVALC